MLPACEASSLIATLTNRPTTSAGFFDEEVDEEIDVSTARPAPQNSPPLLTVLYYDLYHSHPQIGMLPVIHSLRLLMLLIVLGSPRESKNHTRKDFLVTLTW